MPFPPIPPAEYLFTTQTAGGFVTLTLHSDEDLSPDDYTWTTRWWASGNPQIVASISSVVVVKGGSPIPTIKGITGGSREGSALNPAPTFTFTYPSYNAGDLVIVWASHASVTTGMGIPGGWTNIFTEIGASEQLRCWDRIMTGSEGATLTLSSSASLTNWACAMLVIENPHGTATTAIDDFEVHHYTVNTEDNVAGPVTVTVDGALAIPAYCVDPTGAFQPSYFTAYTKTGGEQLDYFVQAQLV